MHKIESIADLTAMRERLSDEHDKEAIVMTVCGGTGCKASRCQEVIDEVEMELESNVMNGKVQLKVTGCHGFCEQGPIMVIDPSNIFYCNVKATDVRGILSRTVEKGEVIDKLLYTDPVTDKKVLTESEIPFYQAQTPTLLSMNRRIDPCSIEDYFLLGGYEGLVKVLTGMSPEEVVDEITASGLRGRGGGGFPTGTKWAACRAAAGDEKFVICNADEGDPGAFMDRCILEGNPHAVLEGMLIGAHAIGSEQGYIYVRNEYPLAVKNSRTAISQAREHGLLGDNILGTGMKFDIEIARGGGAFVCGESTALMASLEGKVGEPRPKDVHTVEFGLWNKPSNLNNVETWANVPSIINNGADWFAGMGTEGSKGTKILALTGQVKNTGLVEVAFGTTIRTVVDKIGGGGRNGNKIKAVQTGGPSGGCLPESMFDLPIDFDILWEKGSMIGSGGLVVMDDKTCMVDVAKYFLKFLQDESCGKCVPCRVGVDRLLEIVTDITEGRGTAEKIELLKELGDTVAHTALCGLGKTAPNPALSTLRYFAEEYDAHINEKRCPAGVCKALIEYSIDAELCNGCGACLKACPSDAISGEIHEVHSIDLAACDKCGICPTTCTESAIIVQ
ncbi:MAG: NADH-ubiquinone oxidoreductase-F iron-sulfur binding region domain-containing protein [bacterium]